NLKQLKVKRGRKRMKNEFQRKSAYSEKINWENMEVSYQGQVIDAHNFLHSINDCFLQQHVFEPIHNIDGENPTNLDLVFTGDTQDITNVEILPPIGKSHHAVTLCEFVVDDDLDGDIDVPI
ncbi:hypothetical protein SK128_022149, partial [Halocaridina rubra]